MGIIIQTLINIFYPILLVLLTRFSAAFDFYHSIFYKISQLIIYIIFTFLFLLQLLSVNNYAFGLITRKTFEFWIKILYTLILCTAYSIFEIKYNDFIDSNDIITILSLIFQQISVLLMVILVVLIVYNFHHLLNF